eukprot:TRINITY_DN4936_c0_g2_i2.p2 TRINITY_DN4936_c0_g2~~TRINITY_DN4936_c0_g2_i2.p2  ORF type:complete len:132 (+),score=0.55 TRINITY_DN4936_c0_g2_i2:307-702(+)
MTSRNYGQKRCEKICNIQIEQQNLMFFLNCQITCRIRMIDDTWFFQVVFMVKSVVNKFIIFKSIYNNNNKSNIIIYYIVVLKLLSQRQNQVGKWRMVFSSCNQARNKFVVKKKKKKKIGYEHSQEEGTGRQ